MRPVTQLHDERRPRFCLHPLYSWIFVSGIKRFLYLNLSLYPPLPSPTSSNFPSPLFFPVIFSSSFFFFFFKYLFYIFFHFFFPALQLPTGKTTVMHLVSRENLPEPNNQGNVNEKAGKAETFLCVIVLVQVPR